MNTKQMFHVCLAIIGASLVAIGYNLFLIPHSLLAGGISGISMMIGYMTHWSIPMLYFLLNFPLLMWGWFVIGRKFILFSILSVLVTTWLMSILPTVKVTSDPILAGVFGGVIIGAGVGLSLRVGGSTGGFDILGAIVTRKKDFPIGLTLFVMNGIIVLSLGIYTDNWDLALYSVLSRYVTGRVVDTIYVINEKVTAFIITDHKDELLQEVMKLPHGITIMKSEGAYSHSEKTVLMTVTTRYELSELTRVIKNTDPKAFVNIVETVSIMGNFVRRI